MFCKHCHCEFRVSPDTLGSVIRCPNCSGTLRIEDTRLCIPCPKCGNPLELSIWMIGSGGECPFCRREIPLTLGEESYKYLPDASKPDGKMPEPTLHVGDRLGKYLVLRCLGIGGMGEVYLAEHTVLKTRCALKLLKPALTRQQPEMRERFLREARLAAKIQHPNLIGVLDAEYDQPSDRIYIAMEYVNGVSIEQVLAGGSMQEKRVLEIVGDVVLALRAAAEHRIIHRDIKPANIMLGTTGQVKLADLGIAKAEGDEQNMTLTRDNSILGTPNYASPEQLRSSHTVDSRTDIYSLGATMYHMLTGQCPFEAESVFGVMANVLEKELPPVHRVNPEISVGTSELIARMTAKNPDDRPGNFDELLAALKNGNRRRFRVPWKTLRFSRRAGIAVAFAVSAAVLLAAAGVLFFRPKAEAAPAAAGAAVPERREKPVTLADAEAWLARMRCGEIRREDLAQLPAMTSMLASAGRIQALEECFADYVRDFEAATRVVTGDDQVSIDRAMDDPGKISECRARSGLFEEMTALILAADKAEEVDLQSVRTEMIRRLEKICCMAVNKGCCGVLATYAGMLARLAPENDIARDAEWYGELIRSVRRLDIVGCRRQLNALKQEAPDARCTAYFQELEKRAVSFYLSCLQEFRNAGDSATLKRALADVADDESLHRLFARVAGNERMNDRKTPGGIQSMPLTERRRRYLENGNAVLIRLELKAGADPRQLMEEFAELKGSRPRTGMATPLSPLPWCILLEAGAELTEEAKAKLFSSPAVGGYGIADFL